jgi:hypothetical protein
MLKLCSDGAAYEAKPKNRTTVDILSITDEVKELLKMKVRVSLPAMLILEGDDGKLVNIFPSGRLLLRKFPSEEDAEEITKLLSSLLYSQDR